MLPADLIEAIPLTGIRALIATRMTQSLRDMAQLTLHRAVDASGFTQRRDTLKLRERPSVNDLVLAATARVLAKHPLINATLEAETIYRWRRVHLGVAVAVQGGLVVPVIRNAHALSLPDLQSEAARLARAARAGTLTLGEMQGATFTVSNLGGLGIDAFTPIVNPPQVAILGVGRIVSGRMTLSLTIDHRAVDGAPGAVFLGDLAEALEHPEWMQ
jgi:pyruvate dehydrogenase E2 component (dihydrolipoamide acetyltransferase)